jgi:enamine deaminase RidA (YjgF/YER057c/UK114 family)
MINLKLTDDKIKEIFVFKPISLGSCYDELKDCAHQFSSSAGYENLRILKLNIFVQSDTTHDFKKITLNLTKVVPELFRHSDFPVAYIAQPPADGSKINIEISAINLNPLLYSYQYSSYEKGSYYILQINDSLELYGTVSDMSENSNVFLQSNTCLEGMKNILSSHGLSLHDIVRQWMYVGKINDLVNYEITVVDNYQLFNKSRADYYKAVEWINGYPAATGIGLNIPCCTIEFTARKKSDETHIIPLKNPLQIDAHKYTDKYIPLNSKINSPKFERGKVVLDDDSLDIYISGTAAIIGEDSVDADIKKQTQITLDNITKLCTVENLAHHGINIGKNLPKFSAARVYIKQKSDFAEAEEICRNYFGNIPIIFVEADICRNELLVEIEAELSYAAITQISQYSLNP